MASWKVGANDAKSARDELAGKFSLVAKTSDGMAAMFDCLGEDWRTYDRNPFAQGMWVMVVYRFGRWRYSIRRGWLRKPFSLLYKLLKTLSEILTGIDLPCEAIVGPRFRIDHFGGIVISGDAIFGEDCIIRNGVTVGLRNTGKRGSPVIGDRVDIGAGAKVLGSISIGNDVVIGANAVVLSDVPSNSVAVGIPARIIPAKPKEDEFKAYVATAGISARW